MCSTRRVVKRTKWLSSGTLRLESLRGLWMAKLWWIGKLRTDLDNTRVAVFATEQAAVHRHGPERSNPWARSSREGSPPHSLQRDGADHLREQWTATRMDSGELDPVPTPITARRNGGESTCNLPRTFPPYTSGIVWIVAATVSTVQRSRLEQRTTWILPPRVL